MNNLLRIAAGRDACLHRRRLLTAPAGATQVRIVDAWGLIGVPRFDDVGLWEA